jgi:hypothetical protein
MQIPAVMEHIVMLLASTEYKVYQQVRLVLKTIAVVLGISKKYVEILVGPMNALLAMGDDPITIRTYETIAELAIMNTDGFEVLRAYRLLEPFTDFDFDDLVVCLNMIEVFIELSKTESGFEFLEKTGILQKLSAVRSIPNPFVLGSMIKFWGFLCFHCSSRVGEIQSKFRIFDTFHGLYSSGDHQVRDQVMVALGNIGATSSGLAELEKQGHFLNFVLTSVPQISGEARISCLRTISCLLSSRDCDSACRTVYHSLGSEPFKVLVQYAKNSIEEVSIAALACIKEVVQFPWGLRDFAQSDTYSFFLERKRETPVIIVEWKYSIVQLIALNSNALSFFPTPVFDRFVEFNREGPFKSEYTPQVAFESSA